MRSGPVLRWFLDLSIRSNNKEWATLSAHPRWDLCTCLRAWSWSTATKTWRSCPRRAPTGRRGTRLGLRNSRQKVSRDLNLSAQVSFVALLSCVVLLYALRRISARMTASYHLLGKTQANLIWFPVVLVLVLDQPIALLRFTCLFLYYIIF